jgi:hypothetical protein
MPAVLVALPGDAMMLASSTNMRRAIALFFRQDDS